MDGQCGAMLAPGDIKMEPVDIKQEPDEDRLVAYCSLFYNINILNTGIDLLKFSKF